MKVSAIPARLVPVLLLWSTASLADSDLGVGKYGPANVVAGTDIVYDITVYNDGPDPATGVVVSDIYSIPLLGEAGGGLASCSDGLDNDSDGRTDLSDADCEGLVFLGATVPCTSTGATATEGTLDCTIGDLAVGEMRSFTVKFHVSPGYVARTGLFVTNQATVAGDQADPEPGNDESSLVETVVDEVSDLRITKLVEPGEDILAGQTVFYTIWVDNYGPSAARNVTIYDTLLSSGDVSIQSCAFSVSQGSGTITQFTCTTGPLVQTQFGTDIGTFRTNILYPLTPASLGRLRASFRMVSNAEIHISNTSRVASETFDPVAENNYAESFIDVVPVADLDVSGIFGAEGQVPGEHGLVLDPSAVLPPMPELPNYNFGGFGVTAGRRIEFEGGPVNDGPSPATNVQVEFLLPADTSVLSQTIDPNEGTADGRCYTDPAGETRRKVICLYDVLAVGETARASFQLLVDPGVPAGTQPSIHVVASSDEFDPGLSDNVTGLVFGVNNWADLNVLKFAVGSAVAGTSFHYEIQLRNAGPSTAHDVTLRDFLPSGVTFLGAYVDDESLAPPIPLPCGVTAGSNALFCDLGDVPATGAVPLLVFVNVLVDPDLADGDVLTNIADVSLADTPDPFGMDNGDSAAAVVSTLADVGIVKTSDADIYSPSSRVTFIVTVTNDGPSTAKDIEVIDTLPATKSAVYLLDSGGCALAGTTLTCPVGTLESGEAASFNVYMVIKGSKGKITNTATVSSSTNDLNLDNNTSLKTVLVKGGTGKGGGKGK